MADINMAAAVATVKRRSTYLKVSSTKLVEESIEQASAYIQTGDIDNSAVYSQTCMNLGSTIDSAIALNEVPSSSHLLQLLLIIKEVYRRRTELLQPSLMLLMLPIKAACRIGWFPDEDIDDLLMMAKEVSYGFSNTDKMNIEPSDSNSHLSNIVSRFYPKMKVEKILASFDVEAGYGTFVADFHISKGTLPRHCRDLWLLVARMDNMETAACNASPSDVDFLVNGSRVPGRTKSDMYVNQGKGPQLPSNLTKMIKYGVNLLQVLGDFDGRYMMVVAFMNTVSPPYPPQLQDYVHQMASEVDSECEVIEMSSRASLHCPISRHRIRIPVKGHLCKHPQCFDYENFMEINSRRPTWKCPVCTKPVCNIDIRIDQDFVKILSEVAEDVSDVMISSDGSWTSMATESQTTDSNRNTMSQDYHVLEEANYTLPSSSSFVIHNPSVLAIGVSAERPSAIWQSTVTRDAASSAQIQQFGNSRLRSQASCSIVCTPPSQQTTHHMNPMNSSTTQPFYDSTNPNPNHPSAETQPQVQTDGPGQTRTSFTPVQLPPSSTNPPHPVPSAFQHRNHHVSGQPQPAPTVRPPLPTQLPGDPMPPQRMRGSLKGDKLAAAQHQFLAPPRQPARANEPWSRPTPTLPVELLMQHTFGSSENTPNGSNFRYIMAEQNLDPPSPVNEEEDAAICPLADRLPTIGNNYHLDITAFHTNHPVVIAILRRHPLAYALTATVEIPLLYLQQVWSTIRHEGQGDERVFIAALDHLTLDDLRTILHLPTATDGGRVQFDDLLTDDVICNDVHNLGYNGELVRVSQFHRNNLAPLWYAFFSILHRCLSGKTRGIDRCSGNFLRLFHAVAYDRHIDFAEIIWRELQSNVRAMGTGAERSFIPFMRFLQIAIRSHMNVDPTIRRRSTHPTCPHFNISRLANRASIPGVVAGRIPETLLSLANLAVTSVRAYRASLELEATPTVQREPGGPTQGVHPKCSRTYTRKSSVRSVGAAGQGVSRAHVRGSTEESSSGPPRSPSPVSSPPQLSPILEEPSTETSRSPSPTKEACIHDQTLRIRVRDGKEIRERRDKRLHSVSASQPFDNRVTTSSTPPHELGHGIEEDVSREVDASTGGLSGPGVGPTEFVSREVLDGALKVVQLKIETKLTRRFQEEIEAQIGALRCSLKGKEVIHNDPSPVSVPPPPPSSVTSVLTTADLKATLLTRLLDECFIPAEYEADLLSLLRSQSHDSAALQATITSQAETIRNQEETIRLLRERVAYKEDTCRSLSLGSKRRHDDQDDADRREGEKRQ